MEHDIIITDEDEVGRRTWAWPPQRVVLPEFEIYSNPTININDVKQRRYDLINRSVQKARDEIMAQEDAEIFKILDSIAESGNKDI